MLLILAFSLIRGLFYKYRTRLFLGEPMYKFHVNSKYII